MKKQLVWSGALMDPSGYGEVSRQYMLGVDKLGGDDWVIQCKPKNFWNGEPLTLGSELDDIVRLSNNQVDYSQPYIFVQHLTPENYRVGYGKRNYHIGITTFETNSLPEHWQLQMRTMDELWTFSHWGKEIFEETGIRRPVIVIPHGVDTDLFCPEGERIVDLEEVFVFGANFDWTERKNPAALLKAFYSTFKPDEEVTLVLKCYYQFPIDKSVQYIKAYVEHVKAQMGLTDAPPVVLISEILSPELLAGFYRSLDCYVLPSRGEGWSLTHSEAMSTGLPAIALDWSGSTEFMNDENSYLLKNITMVEISENAAGPKKAYIGHKWADCDVGELAATMRHVYENREEAKAKGKIARQHMVDNFQWSKAAGMAMDRLTQVWDEV